MTGFDTSITRRGLLGLTAGLSTAAALGLPPLDRVQAAATGIDLDGFLALSARLTGTAIGDLDRGIGARILDLYRAAGEGEALAVLAATGGAPAGALADGIVASWYSGVATIGGRTALVAYPDALMWAALDFTKPGGYCGGETGYWAEPPQDG